MVACILMAACSKPTDPGTTEPTNEVTAIAASGQKTKFTVGEDFSTEGLIVTATMSRGDPKTLSFEEFSVDSSEFQKKVGRYTIRLTLSENKEISTSYQVAVYSEDMNWEKMSAILDAYGGEWLSAAECYDNSVMTGMPESPLLGNGDVGAVSSGDSASKSWLFSKNDFWSGGNLNSGVLNREDPNATTLLPVGGITLQQKSEEAETVTPLTRLPGVTASASSKDTAGGDSTADKAIDGNEGFGGDAAMDNIWISSVYSREETSNRESSAWRSWKILMPN